MCVKGGATSHEGERDWKGMTATGFTVALSHSKIKNSDNNTQRTTRATFALSGDRVVKMDKSILDKSG